MTHHTCNGPKFGKLTKGCPSCDELLSGKRAPVRWNTDKKRERARRDAIRNHDCTKSKCGPVCVAFDW